MSTKKIIAVFGATGAQGGGLAKAILKDPQSEFSVRAITRDPNSEKAQELKQLGAEVVQADIDDADSVQKALQGAYGAFFVTFFWAHFSPETEQRQARTMAEAAKAAGIQHAIWSTLEDTRNWVPLNDDAMPTLQGKYKVPHFDAKGEMDAVFTALGVPVTFLRASFYWDNFIYFGSGPQRAEDGKYYLTFPLDNKKMAGIAAEDIGKCAYGIFKAGLQMIGKTVGVAGEQLTIDDIAGKMSKTLHVDVHYRNVSPDTFRGFGFPGSDDLGNMFQFYRDYEEDLNEIRNVELSRKLNPELLNFDQWLEKYGSRIPLS
jgi:uncharacterized protein YbjT (DUF2867 family)